jgi:NAD(P)-dependent dehydrogenase (short-subunit alcohol dehydrogenase family)
MRLKGKVTVITGAGSGIGKEAAFLFAGEGASVVVADLEGKGGERVASALEADGKPALFVPTDVSKAASVEAMVAATEERFGRLDAIYNNAGIFPDDDGSVTDTAEEVWDRVMSVNLKGVFFGCKYAIPAMLRSGGGSIINVASFVALMGAAVPQVAYTASKGGVLSMTREIATEFARKGIRANALCPGPVETPLTRTILANEEKRKRRLTHIPPGRFAQPQEIAQAALFLASDESSFVNGATFTVDGGITAAYITPE